jgi:hypothetical protein
LTDKEREDREASVIDELLRELDELRELDRRRSAHAPGSASHEAATVEVDARSRRLMDRFRDLRERDAKAAALDPDSILMRPLDMRRVDVRERRALLN